MTEIQFACPSMRGIVAAASCCESIKFGTYHTGPWKTAGEAVFRNNVALARSAAIDIIDGAVPEEGDHHPQKATCLATEGDGSDHCRILFTTPGGVNLAIYWSSNYLLDGTSRRGAYVLKVVFNRDSKYLAAQMLSAFAFSGGGEGIVRLDQDSTHYYCPFAALFVGARELATN